MAGANTELRLSGDAIFKVVEHLPTSPVKLSRISIHEVIVHDLTFCRLRCRIKELRIDSVVVSRFGREVFGEVDGIVQLRRRVPRWCSEMRQGRLRGRHLELRRLRMLLWRTRLERVLHGELLRVEVRWEGVGREG